MRENHYRPINDIWRHPEFALQARAALRQMTPAVQTGFKCYYTAAVLLQQKYRDRLGALFGCINPLPDLFSAELQMPGWPDPNDGLCALDYRQKALTGRSINWLGTYEHGAMRLLRTLEGRKPDSSRVSPATQFDAWI